MRSTPDLSYIVSLYDRPEYLSVCLYALKMQSHRDFEVIVTDNSTDNAIARIHRKIVADLDDSRFRYVRTAGKSAVNDCYWSSEYGASIATGRWLAFPCEDNYFPPQWGKSMLTAALSNNWDVVLCEYIVTSPEMTGADHYFRVKVESMAWPGYKASFMVRADKWTGWVNKATVAGCSGVDRTTLLDMTERELRWGIVRDLHYFHN